MINAAALSPEQKLDYIRDQIIEVRSNLRTYLSCPYCGGENTPVDEHVCCKLFGDAALAVIDRMDKQAAIDFIGQVQDKAARN
jgi:hypothetical protein